MIKQKFIYNHNLASLEIEGLPDFSNGQTEGIIGILSSWKLTLIGSTELEGKKEHLQALITQVLPYARKQISGISTRKVNNLLPVNISNYGDKHLMSLSSSREGVQPLDLYLDDAELSDLVFCLDEIRHDSRILIDWDIPLDKPMTKGELVRNSSILERTMPFFTGAIALIVTSGLLVILPMPTNIEGIVPKQDFSSNN